MLCYAIAGNGQSLCRVKSVPVGHSTKSAGKLVQSDSIYALSYVCIRCIRDVVIHRPKP